MKANAVGEKGRKKGPKQPGHYLSLPARCVLNAAAVGQRAVGSGQLALSLSPPVRVSPLCVERNAPLVRVATRTEGQSDATTTAAAAA